MPGTTLEREITLAIMPAAAIVSVLVLIFLGFAIAVYQSFPGDTDPRIISSFKIAAWAMVAAFVLGIADALLALSWLGRGGVGLYQFTLGLFAATLIIVLLSSIIIVYIMLRMGRPESS